MRHPLCGSYGVSKVDMKSGAASPSGVPGDAFVDTPVRLRLNGSLERVARQRQGTLATERRRAHGRRVGETVGRSLVPPGRPKLRDRAAEARLQRALARADDPPTAISHGRVTGAAWRTRERPAIANEPQSRRPDQDQGGASGQAFFATARPHLSTEVAGQGKGERHGQELAKAKATTPEGWFVDHLAPFPPREMVHAV
jgi:hypothetical protein